MVLRRTLAKRWIKNGEITRPVHIVCSPYKTGTTSVGHALLALGVGTRAMKHNRVLLQKIQPALRDLQKLADKSQGFRAFHAEHADRVKDELAELVSCIAPYDVFQDAPFGHTQIHPFIRKVLAPQARFIWINRARKDWMASVQHWEETHPEIYPDHTEWATNASARRKKMHKFWRRQYRNFKRVRRSGPQQCLELEWDDLNDWTALAAFYGVEAPQIDFPKSNVSRGESPE
ncbi:sulfotransferase [Tropicibacter naphthalenivorans]|uniref:Sulfotransferase family protein n=1 Tax=Tropicibacter naphthalenivorans TaxID=441103 RepID=A0A0P1GZG9_9RHOB|nr:sulfotransferase [Tropicibacter naphthalenivorans]CUH82614.1 hypothetical protein TRN7648_04156 [Tropicibacter naphthalenivorans]SMD08861.1 hypothetical protein SAMN04488093_1185 [Tropicibacter naphthalenivorans]